ncbi:MAG: hydroxyphenylacetyl-CoA thioesterase PaaI [Pseudomonadota bacterium]
MTPDARAKRCAQIMFDNDVASTSLGIRLLDITAGSAVLSMPVRADMLNGHGICHGGFIFLLADSAFAFACNSYNEVVVAQQNQISYIAPGHAGENLVARATEASRTGRSGIYDVIVTGQDDRTIALFRGLSRRIAGQHFEEEEGER